MISEVYKVANEHRIERRNFLKIGAISLGGLVLSLHHVSAASFEQSGNFEPNAFVAIDESGMVTLVVHRSEMGQGIRSTMAGILADELGVDWEKIKLKQAEADRKYGEQNTDGSKSIRDFYLPMRRMGAAARQMLEQAAAKSWSVAIDQVKTENGFVILKGSDSKLSFGELALLAAKESVPKGNDLRLKKKSELKNIGKKMPSVDLEDVVSGKAGYGIDQKVEGMKYAVIARCPVYGGKLKSFDDTETLKVTGVERTVQLTSPGLPGGFDRPLGGIAVVATNTWAAIKGREKLVIEWDDGPNGTYSDEAARETMKEGFEGQTSMRTKVGEVNQSEINLTAEYYIPHYAHSPMEPPVALVDARADRCEVWAPSQSPQWAKGIVARAVGLNPANVKLNVTLLGGGFGRKAKPDFVAEAAVISKACGCPIKLTWTREDDIRHGFYHAQSAQQLSATIDANNKVTAWNHKSAFPSISGTANLGAKQMSKAEGGQGLEDMPYDIPNLQLEVGTAEPAGVRIGWLRSVANINHGFAIGSFMDEIATARKIDPVENLLDLLGPDREIDFSKRNPNLWYYDKSIQEYPWDTGRFRKVIELAAEKSSWGQKLPKGQALGIAAHRSFLTYVACIVKVDVNDGKVSIPEVHYAVNCGLAVNPDRVRAQFEGGAVFGTSLALKSELTVEKGRVKQSNFHDYQLARMADAPAKIEVHIMDSKAAPTGVGEPPVPPFSPALANALFAATGKRFRKLPILEI